MMTPVVLLSSTVRAAGLSDDQPAEDGRILDPDSWPPCGRPRLQTKLLAALHIQRWADFTRTRCPGASGIH